MLILCHDHRASLTCLQAAFTVKEARELMRIPSVHFEPIDQSLYPSDIKKLPRVQKRIAEVLLKGTPSAPADSPKSWALDFFRAPKSIIAESDHVSSMTFTKQRIAEGSDQFDNRARVVATDEGVTMDASLAFRSVGYKSTPLPGLDSLGVPFDSKLGIIPNDVHGRVITPAQGPGDLTLLRWLGQTGTDRCHCEYNARCVRVSGHHCAGLGS
jgi:adrenodoxin-NADP+ reductase